MPSKSISYYHRKNVLKTENPYLFDKRVLKNALAHLSKEKKSNYAVRNKENCRIKDCSESRTDRQIKLRCRQLPNVVHELRKAILRQNWDETAVLLMILCHPGLNLYKSIILKTCFILLFCHPSSSSELLHGFIQNVTGYILDEDVNKFVKILLSLKKSMLKPMKNIKSLACNFYKVTRDPEFEDIK